MGYTANLRGGLKVSCYDYTRCVVVGTKPPVPSVGGNIAGHPPVGGVVTIRGGELSRSRAPHRRCPHSRSSSLVQVQRLDGGGWDVHPRHLVLGTGRAPVYGLISPVREDFRLGRYETRPLRRVGQYTDLG